MISEKKRFEGRETRRQANETPHLTFFLKNKQAKKQTKQQQQQPNHKKKKKQNNNTFTPFKMVLGI